MSTHLENMSTHLENMSTLKSHIQPYAVNHPLRSWFRTRREATNQSLHGEASSRTHSAGGLRLLFPQVFKSVIKEILGFLLNEAPADDDPQTYKEVYAPGDREYTLNEIKAIEPLFFNRKTMRFHGTKKIHKYGNFLVLHNVKFMGGHAFGVGNWTLDQYVIYEFTRTSNTPQGLLLHKGSTKELSDAKQMIKSKDFRSRRQRLGLPEAEEDFKELYTGHEVLRDDGTFRVVKLATGQYFIQTALENVHPRSVPIRQQEDWESYLKRLSANEFKMAAVIDYGCAINAGPDPNEEPE
jgi:hypothetical protein